jgi:hypothetical protein
VVFSIIETEWPQVEQFLSSRLAHYQSLTLSTNF